MDTILKVGVKVLHPNMPEWGIGKVLEVASDGKITIFFIDAGNKKFDLTRIPFGFEKVANQEAPHPILDNPSFSERSSGKEYTSLPVARNEFSARFPNGFEDVEYLKNERDYKIATRKILLELLNEEIFRELLEKDDVLEIIRRVRRVVDKPNLIFPNEKMRLKDALKQPANAQLFVNRLFGLLYGREKFKDRFEAFAACLEEIDAAKWTIMTFFPFFAFPDKHIFLKPEITKQATNLTMAELNYKPTLNWLTYKNFLDFAHYLKGRLVDLGLKPRDMIDVQSFLWCITPGKRS
jgi:Protein of unknown function (DUF3553).